jgi:hypothetical protein
MHDRLVRNIAPATTTEKFKWGPHFLSYFTLLYAGKRRIPHPQHGPVSIKACVTNGRI